MRLIVISHSVAFVKRSPLTGFPRAAWYNPGMEVIYIDSLFALNFLIDYCIVLASARVCGVVLRRWRYLLAALLGAAYAAAIVLPGLRLLGQTALKLVLGVAMSLIAFGGEAHLLRCTVVFFAVSAAFGGAVFAASLLAGADGSGGALVSVSGRVLVLSFAACYAAVSVVFRRRAKAADQEIRPVVIADGDRSVTLRGLRDSGNTLHDPVTGCRAAVADRTAILPLFEGTRALTLPDDAIGALEMLSALPGCAGRFRLLPYSAVGVSGALLVAFRPERVTVAGVPEALLIALSPSPLSATGEFEAVLPPKP